MRIIITGQTGTSKKHFAERIVRHYLDKLGLSSSSSEAKDELRIFEVEKRLVNHSVRSFITGYDLEEKRRIWIDTLHDILDEIEGNKSRHVLLFMHATYYREGHFFSPISWDALLKFRPDCIITLIDDIYDIWHRVRLRTNVDTELSLQEILHWRNTEILYCQALSKELRIDHTKFGYRPPAEFEHLFGKPVPFYVMSVKHSPECFTRLMFERHRRDIVYASFPITRTRLSTARRSDIDTFRRQLRTTGAIVVDPLMVDELRMHWTDERWKDLSSLEKFREYQNDRWEIREATVPPPSEYFESPFSRLNSQQVADVVKSINAQIRDRDFLLVGQSNRLVAFRPFYPEDNFDFITGTPTKNSTHGVTSEIHYALGKHQEVWVFHPKCDYHPDQSDEFFTDSTLWNRVRFFPSKTQAPGLATTDISGFEELLRALRDEVIHD